MVVSLERRRSHDGCSNRLSRRGHGRGLGACRARIPQGSLHAGNEEYRTPTSREPLHPSSVLRERRSAHLFRHERRIGRETAATNHLEWGRTAAPMWLFPPAGVRRDAAKLARLASPNLNCMPPMTQTPRPPSRRTLILPGNGLHDSPRANRRDPPQVEHSRTRSRRNPEVNMQPAPLGRRDDRPYGFNGRRATGHVVRPARRGTLFALRDGARCSPCATGHVVRPARRGTLFTLRDGAPVRISRAPGVPLVTSDERQFPSTRCTSRCPSGIRFYHPH
jgi:hypothetical protein